MNEIRHSFEGEDAGTEKLEKGGKSGFLNAPERIRTSNLRFRRPTLYPIELQALASGGMIIAVVLGYCK